MVLVVSTGAVITVTWPDVTKKRVSVTTDVVQDGKDKRVINVTHFISV